MFLVAIVGIRFYFGYQIGKNAFNRTDTWQFDVDDQTGDVSLSADSAQDIMARINARMQGSFDQDSASPSNSSPQLDANSDRTQNQLNAWEILAQKNAGQSRAPS